MATLFSIRCLSASLTVNENFKWALNCMNNYTVYAPDTNGKEYSLSSLTLSCVLCCYITWKQEGAMTQSKKGPGLISKIKSFHCGMEWCAVLQ